MEFEQLYETYSNHVYSYIFLFVRNKETAEDLTQETFIKAYRKLSQFKGNSKISTWLIQIARNAIFDYYRKKKIKEFLTFQSEKEQANFVTPQEIVIKGEEVQQLYKHLSQLKMEYREVLILRKVKEFSIRETAEILGWDEVKVKNTTTRAMQALKNSMQEKGGGARERFSKT